MADKLFTLVAAENGPATVMPFPEVIFAEVPDPEFFVAAVAFDAGTAQKDLTGVRLVFICHTPAIDTLDFQIDEDNVLHLIALNKEPVSGWEEVYGRLDPHDDPIEMEPIESAGFKEITSSYSEETEIRFENPAWCQQPVDYSDEGFRFVAEFGSTVFFGSLYLFYNPQTRVMRQLFQCT